MYLKYLIYIFIDKVLAIGNAFFKLITRKRIEIKLYAKIY